MRTLLVISQVYVPDPAAVGQHVADVAEEMARRGWRVLVYTSARGYDDPTVRYPGRETLNGVEVRRLGLSSFGKRSILIRLIAQTIFMVQAVGLGLLTPRLSAVLVSTSPPFAGVGGALLARLRGAPLTWWVMDLNPDQMIAAGKIGEYSLAARLFDWFNRVTLRQSTSVITLDRFMKDRLATKLEVQRRIFVLPPWPPHDDMIANSEAVAKFRTSHGLGGRFVVMYSGNHALHHPLTTLLDAAKACEGDHRLIFVFVGGGEGKKEVERRMKAGASNVLSLPYQPLALLSHSLAAGDLHVVTMADEMVGIIHPCKIYGALAIGRPILFFGPKRSHAGEILAEEGVGWCVAHGDVSATVAAIQTAVSRSPEETEAQRERARRVGTGAFSRRTLISRCGDILSRTAGLETRIGHGDIAEPGGSLSQTDRT